MGCKDIGTRKSGFVAKNQFLGRHPWDKDAFFVKNEKYNFAPVLWLINFQDISGFFVETEYIQVLCTAVLKVLLGFGIAITIIAAVVLNIKKP